MPFVNVPGLKGKVFVPEADVRKLQKYPCRDCFSCQWCSDDRCHVCRNQVRCRGNSCNQKKHGCRS